MRKLKTAELLVASKFGSSTPTRVMTTLGERPNAPGLALDEEVRIVTFDDGGDAVAIPLERFTRLVFEAEAKPKAK